MSASLISTTFAQKANVNTLEGTKLRKDTKRRVEARSQINNKNRRRARERGRREDTPDLVS
jgi:hypothetical protein